MKTVILFLVVSISGISIFAQQAVPAPSSIGGTRTPAVTNWNHPAMQHLREAQIRYRNMNFLGALRELDNAVASDQFFADAYAKRALVKMRMGMASEALQDAEIASRLNPYIISLMGINGLESRQPLLALPDMASAPQEILDLVALKQSGELLRALQMVNEMLEWSFEDRAILYKIRGNIHLINGQIQQALWDYTMALELEPELVEALHNRALAHWINLDPSASCNDLNTSQGMGYLPSQEKLKYFCTY